MKTRITEKEFQAMVIRLAKLCGWTCAHFRAARTRKGWRTPVAADGKGFPDLLLIRGARMLVAELKVGSNTVTSEQDVWLALFRVAGVETYVWYPDSWRNIERVLKGE